MQIDQGKNVDKLVKQLETSFSKFDAKQEILSLSLHAADLGHNTKVFKVTQTWAYLLTDEFWAQGDLEKQENLPVSFLCDRNTANIPKSQVGFIREIIIPCFNLLENIFPGTAYLVSNAKENMNNWNKIDMENFNKLDIELKKKKDNEKIEKKEKDDKIDKIGNDHKDDKDIKDIKDKNDKNDKNDKKTNMIK